MSDKKDVESVQDKQLVIIAKLRQIALQQMRKTGYSAQFHTLQKTEVADGLFEDKTVIERFNNLFSQSAVDIEDSEVEAFIKFCTVKIKHALIDHMRKKSAEKRGGKVHTIPLDDSLEFFTVLEMRDDQIEHLNDALEELRKESPTHANLIDNKYFLGMKHDEIAKQLNVSLSKIEKDSHYAIAWLKRELSK